MVVVALLIAAALLFATGLWGARDLIEDEDGALVDRHELVDKYGRISPSRHNVKVMRRRQARIRRCSRRLERLKRKVSAMPLERRAK